eukprot:7794983-Alexandrium_andersonii.AAC.1
MCIRDSPPGSPVLRNGISIEPNRSTEPKMTKTEPTEPSASLNMQAVAALRAPVSPSRCRACSQRPSRRRALVAALH